MIWVLSASLAMFFSFCSAQWGGGVDTGDFTGGFEMDDDWARLEVTEATLDINHKSKVIYAACKEDTFQCPDGKCIYDHQLCDGFNDCSDKSDELRYNEATHNNSGVPCFNKNTPTYPCLLPTNQRSKINHLCKNDSLCGDGMFRCRHNFECIDFDEFCNGFKACGDNSDEFGANVFGQMNGMLCYPKGRNGPRNRDVQCLLPSYHVCDNHEHCIEGVDEAFCKNGKEQQDVFSDDRHFRCLDRSTIIHSHKRCDGIIDCNDLSDECLCFGKHNNSELNQLCANYFESKFNPCLNSSGDKVNSSDISGKFCRKKTPKDCSDDPTSSKKCDFTCAKNTYDGLHTFDRIRAKKCDGIATCKYNLFEEECKDCPNKPEYCSKMNESKMDFQCQDAGRFGFKASLSTQSEVCNGIEDCKDKSDEMFCPDRFYCEQGNVKNYDLEKVCDLNKDCMNGKDESFEQCANSTRCYDGTDCQLTHFYCEDGSFIDSRKVCNGDENCPSGIDECQGCFKQIFSTDERLLGFKSILPIQWFISVCAVIGNLVAFYNTWQKFSSHWRSFTSVQKSHYLTMLNISIADFLVGVYSLVICIQNEILSEGGYCRNDQKWRSGSACSYLGAMMVIGSEGSVFTLCIITAVRLISIVRPFSKISVRMLAMAIMMCWLISITLAVVPLIPDFEDYFTEKKWYSQNSFVSFVNHKDLVNNTKRLMKYFNSTTISTSHSIGSWKLFEELVGKLNSSYKVDRKFGYYSSHGVCLPLLFPDPNEDPSWVYSFILILINFLAFFFILFGYLSICVSSSARTNAKLQTKVALIILTDMCCWVPISIMGFMKMSGFNIRDDAYVIVGMIILPMNSAINPFLYSKLSELVWHKIYAGYTGAARSFHSLGGHLTQMNSRNPNTEEGNDPANSSHFLLKFYQNQSPS